MPKPKEIEYEFRVCYKMNPHYTGNWHGDMRPGVHGKFDTLKEAQVGMEKCKKFFNEEKVLQELPDERGKVQRTVKTTVHDNVIVWIEEYRNGKYYDPDELVYDMPVEAPAAVKPKKKPKAKKAKAEERVPEEAMA